MLVGRSTKGKNKVHDYLYDFRFTEDKDKKYINHHGPLFWVIDLDNGALLNETTKADNIPSFQLWKKQRNGIKAYLHEILQIEVDPNQKIEEPQSPQALAQYLIDHSLSQNVEVMYCVNFRGKVFHHFYTSPNQDCHSTQIRFWAYPLSATCIGYAFFQPEKLYRSDDMMYETTPEEDILPPKPDTVNRKLAVHVQLYGLTLAHKLGCCTKEEMVDVSIAFSQWIGGLWITFDDENHPRHVAFSCKSCRANCSDAKQNIHHSVQLHTCKSDNKKQWTKILKRMESCALLARAEKLLVLEPILNRLKPFLRPKQRDAWSKCYNHLMTAINKYKIFVHGSDDTTLHAIKVPLAGVFKEKHSKGVKMHVLANNTIAALSIRHIDFININEYINYEGKTFKPWEDDADLWKLIRDWLPDDETDALIPWSSPQLRHSRQNVSKHPKMFGDTTMNRYLDMRGFRNADVIRKLWQRLVTYIVTNFQYDMATRNYMSLSKMSFDIVWLMYFHQSGPLSHSLEMLHPYAEHLIRPWCKGGFSYSANAYLCEGQNLADGPETASSIEELDLTSAYGFSGMNMASPKGFGINFGQGMKSQNRYNLFEFKAVYYTLFKWTELQQRTIISVFSNYSPLGILFVGKFPLDLVAVFDDGAIELVQFDGHYCHGDYRNNGNRHLTEKYCPTLSRYADDKSRDECEEKTMARDEYILNWMIQVNHPNMFYSVYRDCCDSEYHPIALRHAFQTHPTLAKMVQGLENLDGSLQFFKNLANLEDQLHEVTFFALVEGFAQTNHEHFFGPVFHVDSITGNRTSISCGKMLLTSDYYQYLVKNFDFCATKLHWVAYYKRCHDMPQVFNSLVLARQSYTKDSSVAGLLKSIVNYACGYFGLHRSKHPFTRTKIAYRIPKKFNFSRHEVSPLPYFDNIDLYVVKTFYPSSHLKNKSTTPLLHFFGIIEYGKMQINRAIQVLQKHLRPTAFQILYSNVDNLIVACSADSFGEALKNPSQTGQDAFAKDWLPLTEPSGKPGKFKNEWKVSSGQGWKFVTPFCMFYALTTERDSECRHKTNCFKGLGSRETFDIALNVWRKERICVEIEKRKNKLVDHSTHRVTYKM